ncbi:MAG: ribonuclease inhibitor [Maribacter sp.]
MELTFLLSNLLEDPSDFIIFLGRFHPLVVHLPIGFLALAAIAQWATGQPKFYSLRPFLIYLWGLGAASAALAILLGYLLSLSGDYDTDTLFWHKWSGVAVLVSCLLCYLVFKKQKDNHRPMQWVFVALALATMVYTGHLGGNLTHGSTYLWEYAPNTVRTVAGLPPKKEPRPKVTVLDSADVYLDLIAPMMEQKCTSCHNTGKKKGDLLLTSYASMMKGGDHGEVLIPGDVQASELFRRITLPEVHDDFMPSEGKRPLTQQEVAIIEWWISSGAPPNGFVTDLDSEKKTIQTITNYLGLDKNTVLSREVPPANQTTIDSLIDDGFIINRLMKDNYLLEANFSLSEKPIALSSLDLLTDLKEQLIWLDLSNTQLTDASLKKIARLDNLMKLNLSGNPITDKGLQHLAQLTHLESLNLYHTEVSEGVLELLPKLTRLQRIYLWKTKVTDSLAHRILSENKNIKLINNRQ